MANHLMHESGRGISLSGFADHSGTGPERFVYERKAAANYARRFGLCRNPEYLTFNKRIDRIKYFMVRRARLGNDCANYISQALYTGGIPMDDIWYYREQRYEPFLPRIFGSLLYRKPSGTITLSAKEYCFSAAWVGIASQYTYFTNQANGYVDGEIITIAAEDEMKDNADNGMLRVGDLIYFFSIKKGIYHSAMITGFEDGRILYSGHDDSRSDHPVSFSSESKYQSVHVIRIKDSFDSATQRAIEDIFPKKEDSG